MAQQPQEPAFTQFQNPDEAQLWGANAAQQMTELARSQAAGSPKLKKTNATPPVGFGMNPTLTTDSKGNSEPALWAPRVQTPVNMYHYHPDNPKAFGYHCRAVLRSAVQHPIESGKTVAIWVGIGGLSILALWLVVGGIAYRLSPVPNSNQVNPAFQQLPEVVQ